jgi:hypothetical protein
VDTGINDPPIVAVSATNLQFTQGQVVSVTQISTSDPDAGSADVRVRMTLTAATGPATVGTLTLASTAGLTFTEGDGTGDVVVDFTGSIAAANTALSGMTLALHADYIGTAFIGIFLSDLGNTGSGGIQTATGTLTFTVPAPP